MCQTCISNIIFLKILAGGLGAGLYPLTPRLSKPLLPLANRPLLFWQLEYVEAANISSAIVITLQDYAEEVSRQLADRAGKVEIDLVVLREPIGTADALRRVADRIHTDFIVLSGDLVTEASLREVNHPCLTHTYLMNTFNASLLTSTASEMPP
jgi:translation initiation factor eIF-2B subunit gamma